MAETASELNENRTTEEKDEKLVAVMTDSPDNAYAQQGETTERAEDEDTPVEAKKIKADIEDTRREMGETIDAIQEKLSVANITEQVKDEVNEKISSAWKTAKNTVYETTTEKVGMIMGYVNKGMDEVSDTKIVKTASRSPLAVSLIGLGVGMLIYNSYYRRSSGNGYTNKRALSSSDYKSSNVMAAPDQVRDSANRAYDQAADTANRAYDKAADSASQAYNKASDVAGKAYGAVGSVAGQATQTIGNYMDSASDLAHKAYDQYDYYIEENPLAVGAVAAALGAVVGFSIPSTRYESRLVGDTRDRLMQETGGKIGDYIRAAGEAAQEKYDSMKEVAEKTVDTAVQTAKKEAKNKDLM